jgi:hypothetical protein
MKENDRARYAGRQDSHTDHNYRLCDSHDATCFNCLYLECNEIDDDFSWDCIVTGISYADPDPMICDLWMTAEFNDDE